MTKTLTTETIKLWRINAEITLGETDELDPENNAAKAILALTEELLANREAETQIYQIWDDGRWCDAEERIWRETYNEACKSQFRIVYTAPPAPAPAVPEEAYYDDCPDLYPSQPDAWAAGYND